MALKELVPWHWGGLRRATEEESPLHGFRHEIDTLHHEMERLFEEVWRERSRSAFLPETWGGATSWPNVDETEDEKAYRVTVELPGLDEKDIAVALADGVLTIRGEKKQEEEEKRRDYYRKERSFGSFRRTLPVPVEVDESKIHASFRKGVLTIELPKSEAAQKKVKHIDINAA
jgi:HSP20 family protein